MPPKGKEKRESWLKECLAQAKNKGECSPIFCLAVFGPLADRKCAFHPQTRGSARHFLLAVFLAHLRPEMHGFHPQHKGECSPFFVGRFIGPLPTGNSHFHL
jgi:hypothetical protein